MLTLDFQVLLHQGSFLPRVGSNMFWLRFQTGRPVRELSKVRFTFLIYIILKYIVFKQAGLFTASFLQKVPFPLNHSYFGDV